MTVQIEDKFFYKGEEYWSLEQNGILFKPSEYGFKNVILFSTNYYRGYSCNFLIMDDSIYLSRFAVKTRNDIYLRLGGNFPVVKAHEMAIYDRIKVKLYSDVELLLVRSFAFNKKSHIESNKNNAAFNKKLIVKIQKGKADIKEFLTKPQIIYPMGA